MRLLDEQPLTAITGAEGKAFLFYCPACGNSHFFAVNASRGPSWNFDGKMDAPTFTPSLKIGGTEPITDDEHAAIMRGEKIVPRPRCCHLNVTAGKITYHGDCTHKMSGQTIPMEDVDA